MVVFKADAWEAKLHTYCKSIFLQFAIHIFAICDCQCYALCKFKCVNQNYIIIFSFQYSWNRNYKAWYMIVECYALCKFKFLSSTLWNIPFTWNELSYSWTLQKAGHELNFFMPFT